MTHMPFTETLHDGIGTALAFITGMPSWAELMIVLFVGLLLFGRRLPEVGRSLGKSIVEFKRGVREAKNHIEVDSALDADTRESLPSKDPVQPDTNKPGSEKAGANTH